jgi:hypothetical protein
MFKINSLKKVILGGILLGFIIHGVLVITAYYSLKSKIRESEFGSIIFKDDPSIGVMFSLKDENHNPNTDRNLDANLIWRLLVNLNVLDWNTTEDDVSIKLRKALENQLAGDISSNTPTINHLIKVAQNLGSKADSKEYEENLQNLIAACLANGPNAYSNYENAVKTQSSSYSYSENPLAFLLPRQLNPWLWGNKCNQENVVNLLFLHTRIASDFDELPKAGNGVTQKEQLEPTQVYRQINEYFQRIFISVHDDHEVIAAKNWFTIVEGPEQFFMYIVFSIGIMVLLMHHQQIRSSITLQEKAKKFSLIFYRWIQIALPSLGFIGTKRGLSEALGRADSIVRAGSQINQAIAVSNVSETMGVAFTSTLVGLILLMILMIFELYLKYQETTWNE